MTAMLFVALLVGVDARSVASEMALKSLMVEPNFQKEAKFCHQNMDEMLTDPKSLVKAKHVVEQLEALMAAPIVQEQVNTFAERVDADFQEQMKLVTQKMEMEQAKDIEEQMKAILVKSITEQMGALTADPRFQEQAELFAERIQNSEDKMVDKMFDRGLKTFSRGHANLENAMLGKPSSLAVQPRYGMKSSIVRASKRTSDRPASIKASPPRPVRKSDKEKGAFVIGQYKFKVADSQGSRKPSAASTISSSSFKRGSKTVSGTALSFRTGKTDREWVNQDLTTVSFGNPLASEFPSPEQEEYIREAAYLFGRLAVAAVMIHHGQEKILSADAFTKFAIDKYFSFLPAIGGSRVIWAYGAGAAQFAGPILLSLGVFSRLAALSMAGTMVGATYYSVITTGLEGFPLSKMASRVPIFHNYGFETPVLYFGIFALIAAAGPGKLSIAQALGWNDDKSLLGKIKQ